MTNKHLFFFLAGYVLLYVLLFPAYQYVMDPDATGYFSVAEKIVRGNYLESVNGIWSPLNSWLLVPFINYDLDPIFCAKLLNGVFGFVCVWIFFSLITKFTVQFYIGIILMAGVVLLLIDFAFSRMFGDLLVVMLLLIYLKIVCAQRFSQNYRSIVFAGIAGGLAFYAKSYSFYFVLIHLPLVILLIENKKSGKWISTKSFKKIATAIAVITVSSAFWIIMLNIKYDGFIIGQKNIEGTITDIYHPNRIIASAPSPGNYALFDDITVLYNQNITPFTNGKTLLIQVKLVVANFVNLIGAFNEFSFAFILVILVCCYLLLTKNKFFCRSKNHLTLISFIFIWPIGFLLFSIQSRFLWIEDLVVMLLGAIVLSEFVRMQFLYRRLALLFSFLVIGSFFIYPFMELKNQYGMGKDLFEFTSALRQKNVNGNMMASLRKSEDLSNSIIINYLNQTKYYGPYTSNYTVKEIAEAITNYDISYYVYYYSSPFQKETFLSGNLAAQASRVYKDIYPGIVVLVFNK